MSAKQRLDTKVDAIQSMEVERIDCIRQMEKDNPVDRWVLVDAQIAKRAEEIRVCKEEQAAWKHDFKYRRCIDAGITLDGYHDRYTTNEETMTAIVEPILFTVNQYGGLHLNPCVFYEPIQKKSGQLNLLNSCRCRNNALKHHTLEIRGSIDYTAFWTTLESHVLLQLQGNPTALDILVVDTHCLQNVLHGCVLFSNFPLH